MKTGNAKRKGPPGGGAIATVYAVTMDELRAANEALREELQSAQSRMDTPAERAVLDAMGEVDPLLERSQTPPHRPTAQRRPGHVGHAGGLLGHPAHGVRLELGLLSLPPRPPSLVGRCLVRRRRARRIDVGGFGNPSHGSSAAPARVPAVAVASVDSDEIPF